MDKIEEKLQKAEKQCLLNGSRLTLKRKQVLSILLQADKAISAYELISFYKKSFEQKISPISAYRILEFLESVGLVHKIQLANKFVACVHIGCGNNHEVSQFLFCQQCQRVQEMPVNSAIYNELTDKIHQLGYQLCSQQVEFTCICHACLDSSSLPQQYATATVN